MLTAEQKAGFEDSLYNLHPTYSGYSFTGQVYRAYDDFELSEPCAIISWIPGQVIKMASPFTSYRTNQIYKNFRYVQSEVCIIDLFARDLSTYHGRFVADDWLRKMENYIKNSWGTMYQGVSVDRQSFIPYREITEFQVSRLYGLETQCAVYSNNQWNDEPESGAQGNYPVSGVWIEENGGSGMFKMWVIA